MLLAGGGFSVAPADDAAYEPWTEATAVFWLDPDLENLGALAAVTDRSAGGHDLSQATAGERFTNTAAQFGAHRGLVAGATTAHTGMLFDTPWNKPSAGTVYCVVKYVDGTDYQVLWVGDPGGTLGPVMRVSGIGGNGSATNNTGANTLSTAAMGDGETHLIKFGWDFPGLKIYIAIDGGAAQEAVFDAVGVGGFNELGFSSLDVQDLISVLGAQGIFSGWHNGDAVDVAVTAYLMEWAGI